MPFFTSAAVVYADDLKLKDALQAYFSRYHFENGGYDLAWFKIKIGPVFIPLPNTTGRVAAVKIHDLHHLATEYPATLRGEAEIGGWELALGCGPYPAAWLLNLASFFYGLFCFPRPLLRAFLRGRRCRTNLYQGIRYDDALLERSVGDIRAYIALDGPGKNGFTDYSYFILMALLALWPLWFCGLVLAFFAG